MPKLNIFQTLEDRGNPEHIEANGPFECDWDNTWLGHGYYFWDSFKDNAHFWGEMRYKKNNKDYVIGKSEFTYDENELFDLTTPKHLILFKKIVENIIDKDIITGEVTVLKVIMFLKEIGIFPYKASRAHCDRTIGRNYPEFKNEVKFEETKDPKKPKNFSMNLTPAYQICIYSPLEGSGFSGSFEIIYPEKYITARIDPI